MKKTVELSFVNRRGYHTGDFYDEFYEAINHASYNLYTRHGVSVSEIFVTSNNQIAIKMDMPEEQWDHFAIGNHLRGVSAYLIKKSRNKDLFKTLFVGKSFLNYYIIEDHSVKVEGIQVSEEIKLLRDISEKLERIESMLVEMKGEHNGL